MSLRIFVFLAFALMGLLNSLSAQDFRVSAGVLAGVSLRDEPTHPNKLGKYVQSIIGEGDPHSFVEGSQSWTQLNATVFLDAIFGYFDVSVSGIVGTVRVKENQGLKETVSYDSDPSSRGKDNLTISTGLGVKVPIVISEYVTLFPLFGLDMLFRVVPDKGLALNATPLRIGAGGDFSLDKNWFVRVLIDYCWQPYFNLIDFKAGIGTKL